MQITFIRHAEPDWHPDGRHRADPGLTVHGHAQAKHLADRLATWPDVDELWVSPALRAQETAAPVAERWSAKPRTLDWLVEVRQPPAMEGLTKAELREQFGGWTHRTVARLWEGRDGGESMVDFHDRVEAGLLTEFARLGAAPHAEGTPAWSGLPSAKHIVAVCHAGTSGAAIGFLMGLARVPWPWRRFRLGHTGLATLKSAAVADGQLLGLLAHNDLAHLDDADRTH